MRCTSAEGSTLNSNRSRGRRRGSGDDRACGGDRRRRPDRADVGGRAGVGGGRRRHRRTTHQPGGRWIASRGSSLPHHRGARSAWHRRTIPLGGAGDAGSGLRPDPVGHQRLPHPPQLRARALAEPVRAHPGRLGRRARGSDPSRLRGGGLRSGRHRRRRRDVRRHVAPSGVSRRLRRRTQPDPQGRRHRLRRVGSLDQLDDRRGRDGRGAGVRLPSRQRRPACHRSKAGRGADSGRPHRTTRRPHRRPQHGRAPRGTRRRVRDGLRASQRQLDLPVHRHDAPGGVLPPAAVCCWPGTPHTCIPRRAARASTPACRMP